ncbi:MAG: AMP-binding protein [Treponemataceae bacterium]|nr:AMP-binding protein [Treponemataceae bacterium]
MSKKNSRPLPWLFLEQFRGTAFKGEWPTLNEVITISSLRFPDRPCLTVFDPDKITLTYSQTVAKMKEFANWLLSKGFKKGDRVAVTGKNSPEWTLVFYGTFFAGGVIVPIDHGLHENEVENLLATAEPKFFFVDEEKYDYFKTNAKGYEVYSLNKVHPETYVYDLKSDRQYAAELPQENDLAALLFTSGTTGNPKGVMLTHKNMVSDCFLAQTNLIINEKDTFYALLPVHHSYTMQAVLICGISVGAEVLFGKTLAVSKMLREMKEGHVTLFLGVPLLFNKLLAGIMKGVKAKGPFVYGLIRFLMGISYLIKKITGKNVGKKMFKAILDKASIGTWRVAISGGGPLAPSVFKAYQELGIDFIQGYGLTETSPIIALNPIENFKIDSVGAYFAPYMQMRIDNPDEKGIGEVQVKGPMVMQGYYKMPEETAEIFTEDGWLKTGDLGRLDEENYLYLSGRAKNLIVTEGGKNVFPEEIENAFQLYNEIEQITVQGYVIDAKNKSEGVEALVYPSDDLMKSLNVERNSKEPDVIEKISKTVKDIIDKVNKTLQPYARITKITILEKALEMTTSKKVKRTYKKSAEAGKIPELYADKVNSGKTIEEKKTEKKA